MNAVMGALRFKGFTLDVVAGDLMKGEQRVALRPQPFKVLAYLAQHSGRLIKNSELVEGCWDNPKQTSANSLAQCIKAIREALGESDQEIVRTVHGRGYIFAAPVSEMPAERARERPQESIETPAAPAVPSAAFEPRSDWRRLLRAMPYAPAAAVAAAVVLLAGAWAVWSRVTRPAEPIMAALPSIAVLPVKAVGDDEPDRRGADALTNEIETELSRAPRGYDLRIRSAPGYTGPLTHPRKAGRELGVRYLVLGSMRREGDTRLVNMQIVEAEGGRPVWAAPFSFQPDEPGAQNLVATRIARTLRAEVLHAEVRLPLPARPQANQLAMLGRALMSGEGGIQANRKAMEFFDKARALDPNSIPALLGYGRTRVNLVLNRWVPPSRYKALLNEAEPMITHAAEIAPTDAGVHVLRCAYLRALSNHAEAIAECERAVGLQRNYPLAHGELGRAVLETGDTGKAIGYIEEALRLSPSDPYAPAWCYWAGMVEAHAGNYEKALDWLRQARGAKRGYPNTLPWLAIAYAGLDQWETARSYMKQHRTNFPKFSIAGWKVAFPHSNPAVTKQRLRLEVLLRELGAPETPPDDKVQTGLVR
ncbi:MAG TPA: winged helix-turn-helix domain-containing protein [Hyphomicrobiaceae bacterium]|jgi:DNA-binding winged helix-turn-helix (wHTH) protein/TolB-like protein